MTASPDDIESARLSMLEARKVLADYETFKGVESSCEHMRLIQVFTKATAPAKTLTCPQLVRPPPMSANPSTSPGYLPGQRIR